MKVLLSIFFIGVLISGLLAQTEIPPLVTDRPDQTESAAVVPQKSLQIETGVVLERDKIQSGNSETELETLSLATTLLRIGLTNFIELRLGSEFTREKTTVGEYSNDISGMNGLAVGAKVKLLDENNLMPELAVLVNFDLPVGNEDLVGDETVPGFLLAAAHTLSPRVGFGYNLGMEWGADDQRDFIYSAALGIGLTEQLSGFLEIYGSAPKDGDTHVLFDSGVTYLVKSNLQLDASVGFALTDHSPDWFANAGVSFRIPR